MIHSDGETDNCISMTLPQLFRFTCTLPNGSEGTNPNGLEGLLTGLVFLFVLFFFFRFLLYVSWRMKENENACFRAGMTKRERGLGGKEEGEGEGGGEGEIDEEKALMV